MTALPPATCRTSSAIPIPMPRPLSSRFLPLVACALAIVPFASSGTRAIAAPASQAVPQEATGPALTADERAALLSRLDALKAKHPSLSANFSEERSSHLLKQPVVSKGTIAFQSPNKFRRELTGSSPSLTISNGKVLWLYYPNFKEAELYTLGQRAMFDDAMAALTAGLNFGQVEKYYKLEAYNLGGKGYRVVLTPKKSNLKRIVQQLVVFLDPDLNVNETTLTLPKGDRVLTHYSDSNRKDLSASTFEFTPPKDANISRPLGK